MPVNETSSSNAGKSTNAIDVLANNTATSSNRRILSDVIDISPLQFRPPPKGSRSKAANRKKKSACWLTSESYKKSKRERN